MECCARGCGEKRPRPKSAGCEADYRSTKCYVIMAFVNYNAINHVHYA
jgi:hypothetical protein